MDGDMIAVSGSCLTPTCPAPAPSFLPQPAIRRILPMLQRSVEKSEHECPAYLLNNSGHTWRLCRSHEVKDLLIITVYAREVER